MPPRRYSRFTFSAGFVDEDDGAFLLEDPEPFEFQEFSDTRIHTVTESDTVFNLAARYFASFERPAGLWWIICDFQPDPIIDPTLKLAVGRTLFIPSERVVTEEIFNEARRRAVTEG